MTWGAGTDLMTNSSLGSSLWKAKPLRKVVKAKFRERGKGSAEYYQEILSNIRESSQSADWLWPCELRNHPTPDPGNLTKLHYVLSCCSEILGTPQLSPPLPQLYLSLILSVLIWKSSGVIKVCSIRSSQCLHGFPVSITIRLTVKNCLLSLRSVEFPTKQDDFSPLESLETILLEYLGKEAGQQT